MANKVMVNGMNIGYIPPAAANDVTYSNTSSGLTATKVQGAIDELNSKVSHVDGTITAGETTVTLTSSVFETTSYVEVYFWDANMGHKSITCTEGSCTIEINEALEADQDVSVVVINF